METSSKFSCKKSFSRLGVRHVRISSESDCGSGLGASNRISARKERHAGRKERNGEFLRLTIVSASGAEINGGRLARTSNCRHIDQRSVFLAGVSYCKAMKLPQILCFAF
jgi:hypothetical protein